MSDGDNAAPGRRGAPTGGDNPWVTRTPRQSMGAAPWERRAFRRPEPGPKDAADASTGNHTGGVTVADLIAKVGANREHPISHRVEAGPEPDDGLVDDAMRDAITEPTPRVRAADLSDLSSLSRRTRRPNWAEGATTQLPAADDRVPPRRHGATTTAGQPKPKRNRTRVALACRAAAALAAAGALALTGSAWQWSTAKNHRLNNVAALDPNSKDIVDPNAQYGDENFLIVGVDSRAGANSEMGAGDTEEAGGARSDTVMLVNIPANRKRVVAVSFPRDLAITPMLCDSWNNDSGTYGSDKVYTETKLNSAYAFGGPKCLVKVVQKLTGLSVNRFMAVDFAGFAKMVDALGGVEVCSTTPLEDYELGTVLENAGRQTIDGHTALNYVRARQVTTEINGDYGRIKRQQLFLSSLLRSLISREVFFNLGKLNNVVNMFISDSYVDNIQTKDLVDLGQSLQNVAAGRISFVTVPTGETDSEGNEPLREEDTRAMFDAIINDEPLPGENNANETTTPTTAPLTPQANTSASATPTPTEGGEVVDAVTTEPREVTVHISNSTGETGLAATAADELHQHGFNVLSPDDYPSTLQTTTVFFSPGNEQAAATVASSFSSPQIERVSGMGNVVQVVLGSDFHTVSAPQPSGSSVQVHVTRGTGTGPTQLPQDLSITNGADTRCE